MESSEQELGLAAVEVTIASFDAQPGIEVSSSPAAPATCALSLRLTEQAGSPAAGVAFRVVYECSLPSSVLPDPRCTHAAEPGEFQALELPQFAVLHQRDVQGTPKAVAFRGR